MTVDLTKEEMDAIVQLADGAIRNGGLQFVLAHMKPEISSAVVKFAEAIKAEAEKPDKEE